MTKRVLANLVLFICLVLPAGSGAVAEKEDGNLATRAAGSAIRSVPAFGSRSAAQRDAQAARGEKRVNRIVGGIESAPNAWPFAASILYEDRRGRFFHYCGGSLIYDRWVLTAAHCEVEAGDVVILGRHDLRQAGGVVVRVERVVTHEHYDPNSHDNDLALLMLAAPGAASMPRVRFEVPPAIGQAVTAIGWGASEPGGPTSAVLRQVTVPAGKLDDCRANYAGLRPPVPITDNMICAGKPGQDSCQGDSGGPLLAGANDSTAQVGIVSFGAGCGLESFPGVYTRIDRYVAWIESKVS